MESLHLTLTLCQARGLSEDICKHIPPNNASSGTIHVALALLQYLELLKKDYSEGEDENV